jgi:hypothetical protein
LVNQTRHFARGRFREIGWLYSANNSQAVAAGKVRPGIVIREQLALVWLQGVHGSRNAAIQVRQLYKIARGVLLVHGGIVAI